MSKHTPGPWSFHGHMGGPHVTNCEHFDAHTVYIGAGDVLLADVCAYKFHHPERNNGFPRVDDFDINLANANLIAAAPDLLDCCVRALAAWTGEGPAIDLDSLRAAIAKATGESA